jgi:peptidyl-tRNA hydrolase
MATKPVVTTSKRAKAFKASARAVVSTVRSTTELRRLEAKAKAEEVKAARTEARHLKAIEQSEMAEAKALETAIRNQNLATRETKRVGKAKAVEEASKLETLKANATPAELRALGDVVRARDLEQRMKLQGMERAANRTVEVLEATVNGKPVPISQFPSTKFEVFDYLKSKNWQTPLEFMLTIMNDTEAGKDVRLDCAKASAPFVHAKLASVAVENVGTELDNDIKERFRDALVAMADTGPPPPMH